MLLRWSWGLCVYMYRERHRTSQFINHLHVFYLNYDLSSECIMPSQCQPPKRCPKILALVGFMIIISYLLCAYYVPDVKHMLPLILQILQIWNFCAHVTDEDPKAQTCPKVSSGQGRSGNQSQDCQASSHVRGRVPLTLSSE